MRVHACTCGKFRAFSFVRPALLLLPHRKPGPARASCTADARAASQPASQPSGRSPAASARSSGGPPWFGARSEHRWQTQPRQRGLGPAVGRHGSNGCFRSWAEGDVMLHALTWAAGLYCGHDCMRAHARRTSWRRWHAWRCQGQVHACITVDTARLQPRQGLFPSMPALSLQARQLSPPIPRNLLTSSGLPLLPRTCQAYSETMMGTLVRPRESRNARNLDCSSARMTCTSVWCLKG